MLQNQFFRCSITAHIFLLVLLMVTGPTQSGWCFPGDNEMTVPDTVMSSCHSIPTDCLYVTTVPSKQNGSSNPFDCNECIDLTFEDLASSLLKSRSGDIDFSPVLAFLQPQSCTSLDPVTFRPLIPHVERLYKEGCLVHYSIKSTVIII